MATGLYFGVSGKARKVNGMYIGVAGKARKVVKAYLGVDGKARLIWDKSFVPPESFIAEMYMRYEPGMSGEQSTTKNLVFTKNSGNQYRAFETTDTYGHIYDLWVTVPAELDGHVDSNPSNTYAVVTDPMSEPLNSGYSAGTIYIIDGGPVQYMNSCEIQFTITLK